MDRIRASKKIKPPTWDEIAFADLLGYARAHNPQYLISAHNIAMADLLMQIERNDITRLLVSMPPRHGKTSLIGETFIPWYLGRNPKSDLIYASYNYERAADVGRSVRNKLIDPIHRAIFPDCEISTDSKGVNKVSTKNGGSVFSVGIGGALTGRGAKCLIIDDPIKGLEDAYSDTAREKINQWFGAVAFTRLAMNENQIVVLQTRWHHSDLIGYLLREMAHQGWYYLNLPAIAEENDPLQRKTGEALWPEAFPIDRLEEIRKTLGSREWNALYQGRPTPSEGGMVDLDWFDDRFDLYANIEFEQIVCSWDTAFKASQMNDPSACTVWGIKDNNFYLIDCFNKRIEFPELKKQVIKYYEKFMQREIGQVPVLIEDAGSGQSLIQELKKSTRIPTIPVKPEKSKEIRLSEVTALMEAGRVKLPIRANWLYEVEEQLLQFPAGRHDDLVDSISQFLRWGGKPKYKRRPRHQLFWK
jgi:predicted phage terminase large subunit-like protein